MVVSALAGKHVKPQAMNTVIKIFSIYTMNIPKCKVVRWTAESLALFLLSTPSETNRHETRRGICWPSHLETEGTTKSGWPLLDPCPWIAACTVPSVPSVKVPEEHHRTGDWLRVGELLVSPASANSYNDTSSWEMWLERKAKSGRFRKWHSRRCDTVLPHC